MITVINAGALQGYSGNDHLIEDETADIIGRKFRSVKQALDAADRLVHIASHGNRKRQSHPYTWVKCMMDNGTIVEKKSV